MARPITRGALIAAALLAATTFGQAQVTYAAGTVVYCSEGSPEGLQPQFLPPARRSMLHRCRCSIAWSSSSWERPTSCRGSPTSGTWPVAKAKQLLAQAGYPNGFEVDLWYRGYPTAARGTSPRTWEKQNGSKWTGRSCAARGHCILNQRIQLSAF